MTGKFSFLALAGVLAFVMSGNDGCAQGANSPEAQRLAAQRNQAAMQRSAVARGQSAYNARMNRPAASGAVASRGAGLTGVRSTASAGSLSGLQSALGAFSVDMGRMPTAAEGLNVLLVRPPGARNWRGPYISQVNWHPALSDPWGSPYRYHVQGTGRSQTYMISSDGPDRTPGTRDDLSVQF